MDEGFRAHAPIVQTRAESSAVASPRGRRTIAVCVDDFGLHAGIDDAALRLADMRRISAISCMPDGPAWRADAGALRHLPAGVELGLHLNLTESFGPRTAWHLTRLVASAYAGILDQHVLRAEIRRQLAEFTATLGRAPDFVDGHQHVHQLPTVRQALLAVLDEQFSETRPWLRCTRPPSPHGGLPPGTRMKAVGIALLGGASFERLVAAHAYPTNGRLLGVYAFDGAEATYLARLGSWLALARDGDLLMCHPSTEGTWPDPILAARIREFRTLASAAFGELLERSAIAIGRAS